MTIENKQSTRINSDIEILRSIAVLSVMFHHSIGSLLNNPPIWLKSFSQMFNGGGGVDLFFVISGFVIGRSYVSNIRFSTPNKHFNITKSFFIRRAFRIYPLAWTWLLLTLVAVYSFNSSGVFGSVDANIDATIAGIFQFANYRFEQTFMREEYGASFVYWSLSLEEQFYIVLPLIMIVFRRLALPILTGLLIYKLLITSYHFAFRYEGLLMGVLLSQCLKTKPYDFFRIFVNNTNTNVIRLICYCCIGAIFIILGNSFKDLGISKFKYAAALALIVVSFASCDLNILLNKGRAHDFFCWIGSRSFALYLAHIPAFYITREIFYLASGRQQPSDPTIILFIFLGISLPFLFAEGSYRMIETPMRNKGISLSKKMTLGASLVEKR
jgi:peptidoglycan/LPS O-acetylase OafA/YrhL